MRRAIQYLLWFLPIEFPARRYSQTDSLQLIPAGTTWNSRRVVLFDPPQFSGIINCIKQSTHVGQKHRNSLIRKKLLKCGVFEQNRIGHVRYHCGMSSIARSFHLGNIKLARASALATPSCIIAAGKRNT